MGVLVIPESGALLTRNFLTDGASIVSYDSDTSPYFPATNLLSKNRSDILLITNNSGGSFIIDLGSAKRPTVIALFDITAVTTSPSSSNLWSISGADDSAMTQNLVAWTFAPYSTDVVRYYLGPDVAAGVVVLNNSNDQGRSITVDSSNRIIVCSGGGSDFRQVRYFADGELDTSFGSGGILSTDFNSGTDVAARMITLSSGKRVVTGTITASAQNDIGIARYNEDGTLDTSFNTTGKFSRDYGSSSNDNPTDIGELSDGSYVVCGRTNNGGTQRFFIIKVNSSGTYQAGATATFGESNARASRLWVDTSNNKTYVVGFAGDPPVRGWAIAAYTSSISLDTGFSANGLFRAYFLRGGLTQNDRAWAVDGDSSGNIVVVGECAYTDSQTGISRQLWAAMRINRTTGVPDSTFGNVSGIFNDAGFSGGFVYDFGVSAHLRAVRCMSNGKILIGGSGSDNGIIKPALMRLNEDGSIDETFGEQGLVFVPTAAVNAYIADIKILMDGRILVTGSMQTIEDVSNELFLARFTEDGQLDTTFSPTEPSAGRRYWKLTMGATNESPAHGKVGFMYLGTHIPIRPDVNTKIDKTDLSTEFKARSGARYHDIAPTFREVDVNLHAYTKEEQEDLREEIEYVGSHTPIVLDLFGNSGDTEDKVYGCMYGYLARNKPFSIKPLAQQTDNLSFKFVESTE